MGLRLAIVGATGLVGHELLQIIDRQRPALDDLGLYASPASAGTVLVAQGREYTVQSLADCDFSNYDAALFSVGDELSAQYVPTAIRAGCAVVDKSNAYRMDVEVPLVVAGINETTINAKSTLVANPNCTTTVLSHALGTLKSGFGLRRVFAATYQSVSGAGRSGVERLNAGLQSAGFSPDINRDPASDVDTIAHNVQPQIGKLDAQGRSSEEAKLVEESRKILGLPQLNFIAHAVRVPVAVGHGIAFTVQLELPATQAEIMSYLKKNPDLHVLDLKMPSLLRCATHDAVEVGRIRAEPTMKNGWSMFVCGDNLRIGAAVNGWRILERMAQAKVIPEFAMYSGADHG